MFPRPMSLHAIPLAPEEPPEEPAGLSPPEEQERLSLREGLRLRRSVDHFARAWYGAIGSLILTGVAVKLFYDHGGFVWTGALASGLTLLAWVFAFTSLIGSRRVARHERTRLKRLLDLERRAPPPPELF